MNPELKKNLSSAECWFRALYVILFLLLAKVAGFVVLVLALVQIVFSLLSGAPNAQLVRFGDGLSKYLFAVFNFVLCKSEDKPFPFADWPEADAVVQDAPEEDGSVNTEASVDAEPVVNVTPDNLQQSVDSAQKTSNASSQASEQSAEASEAGVNKADTVEPKPVAPEETLHSGEGEASEASTEADTDKKKTQSAKDD